MIIRRSWKQTGVLSPNYLVGIGFVIMLAVVLVGGSSFLLTGCTPADEKLPRINGTRVDWDAYPLFGSEYVNSEWDSGLIQVGFNGRLLVLDFRDPDNPIKTETGPGTPAPTPPPSASPTASLTATQTASPTATCTPTSTASSTATRTAVPTATQTSTATSTPTGTASPTMITTKVYMPIIHKAPNSPPLRM